MKRQDGTLPKAALTAIDAVAHGGGKLAVLTGAGISAASGIPTFRGPEGYWTVGSTSYRPEHMATAVTFGRIPTEVWRWYLYRRGVCGRAYPNSGHLALRTMADSLSNRFALVTQNVDGLHARGGHAPMEYVEIHGNLNFFWCPRCGELPQLMPAELALKETFSGLTPPVIDALSCPNCEGLRRPHVMWFDEEYDDVYFPLVRARTAILGAALLLVVGTSASTSLPQELVTAAVAGGTYVLEINPAPALSAQNRVTRISSDASVVLPQLARHLACGQ